MRWYVLFVLGGKETEVREILNEEYAQARAFIPMIEIVHRKKGESHLVQKPMFPSYVFVESTDGPADFSTTIRKIRMRRAGIIRELKHRDVPALYESEQRYLEQMLDHEKVLRHSVGVIEGDRVIVSEGPLSGQESRIIKVDRHKRRALLSVRLLGGQREISVSLEIIKKI